MVRRDGLENTLAKLHTAGVYVTFEECKGRTPMVRGGKEIPVGAHDFDNPWLQASYHAETGGSTGAGTRVLHDLDFLAVRAAHDAIAYDAHGVLDAPVGVWRGVLPDASGLDTTLALCHCGRPPRRWFTPGTYRELDPRLLKFRLANYFVVLLARRLGTPVPWPEHVPVDRAGVIARWAAAMVREHGRCALAMVASRAVRVSVAAQQDGVDLRGVTFVVAGEPVTPAKVDAMRASGATYFTTYGFSEAGRIGRGCCAPASVNDNHLLTDMCAVIAPPQEQPDGDTAQAFHVTSLLPSSPKILLNVESDDHGILEERACGCPLGRLGFTTHVREIRSSRKLTTEGVTMIGSEMLHVIEDVLPRRFGGSPLDYQLIEEEDERGLTYLSLAIAPSVPIADESAVIPALHAALRRESFGAGHVSKTWLESGNLRVRRMQPLLTARGKLLPLYVRKRHAGTAR
jgi:hypothetical protein